MSSDNQADSVIGPVEGPGMISPPRGGQVPDLREILPQYEVLDFIGRGGMGAVYKARQRSLDRVVAVKLLSVHETAGGLDFAARFKVEAQAMARLSHPNIVPVHDFGETGDGQLFYVMEFIEGDDLAKRIEAGGKLPPEEALRIALAVCDALVCAHGQGVVHRDIKPSNILVGRDGHVKVADFGLAKIDDPATASLTLSNTSMGSQGYAAPEVFSKAGTADHRADIYSLAVLIYEMLTGDLPRGMFKLPSEKVPGLDPRFDALICKAMEEEREERQQSVRELREELAAIHVPLELSLVRAAGKSHERDLSPAVISRMGRRLNWRRVVLAGTTAAAVVVAAVWFALDQSKQPGSPPLASENTGWLDVMARLDLTRDSMGGQWRHLNGVLANHTESSNSLLKLPVQPEGSYSLRLRLTRLSDAGGYVVIAFRFREHAAALIMDDSPTPYVGLASIDGKPLSNNGSGVTRKAPFLPIGQMQELLLAVDDSGIVLKAGELEIFRWHGDWSRVSQSGPGVLNDFDGQPATGIGCHMGRMAIHSIELHEGGAQIKNPPTPADWQELLPLVNLSAHSLVGTWKMVNAELFNVHVRGKQSLCELPVQHTGSHDLRVRFTKIEGDDGYIHFGFRKGAGGGGVVFNDRGVANSGRSFVGVTYLDGKGAERTSNWVLERPLVFITPGEEHEVVIRVRDEGLAVLLNGEEVYRWKGDWKRAGQLKVLFPESLGRPVFAVGCYNARIVVRSAALLPVDESEGKLLPPAPLRLGYDPLTIRPPTVPLVFKGHRYQLVPGAHPWNTASLLAARMGGHLATLTTQEEQDWAWQTFAKYLPARALLTIKTRGWWLGGWQPSERDQWHWFTGETFEFTHWGGGQPDITGQGPHRLWLHDRGDGADCAWSSEPSARLGGFLVEWDSLDDESGKPPPASEMEIRTVAEWVLGLPPMWDQGSAVARKAEVHLGGKKLVRTQKELPAGPLDVSRLEMPQLLMDDTAKRHLDIIARMQGVKELMFFSVNDASAIACVRNLTGLKGLRFNAPELNPQQMPDALLVHLARLSELTSLNLEGWTDFTGEGLAALAEKRKLTTLALDDCPNLSDEGLAAIARFTSLKLLSLHRCGGFTDAGLRRLATLTSLAELALGCDASGRFDGSGIEALGGISTLKTLRVSTTFPGSALKHVGRLASLDRLYLSRNTVIIDANLAGLASLKKLTLLRLDDTRITGTGFASFKDFNNALNLHVEDCRITDEGIRAITSGIPNLEALTISRNHPTFATPVMVEALRGLKNLRRLYLGHRFKDDEMPLIATLTNVQTLGLIGSDVTDAGLAHLKPLVNLTALELSGLRLTDACIPAIKELRCLKSLTLTGTKITAEGVDAIKRALPQCQVTQ
ncbi:protein kinase [Prosthecobacter sp.]|uniref:protein kinase domain-containing protein n=1 Tax=Prosthecobacter sp. TaxID=1965333 RepID=UPI002AB81C10|nr:protein kinase [Prosthecobacter sp.]MDZ4401673.1 protein kinase [Prosthecobacter sp.]